MKKAHRYNLGLVGNCQYLAYIDQESSVTWMCWPQMDSSFIFGQLLDNEKGGAFKVIPQTSFKTTQTYVENTCILITTFECEDGAFEVVDFAPRFDMHDRMFRPIQFFRKIKRIRGRPRIIVVCEPRGEYGEESPDVFLGSNHISYKNLNFPIRLTTNASKSYIVEKKEFKLCEHIYLVISGGEAFEAPLKDTFEEFFYRTSLYWRNWVKETFIPNIFQKELIRSVITLKLHQFEDTGAIIASGTTSLPEYPGSGRNWDYRYCWLRDSYFSLSALNSVGHFEEAERYLNFINNILDDVSKLQPVYRINGDVEIKEWMANLNGYLNDGPVRIGNAAYTQKQFDCYGQVILSLLPLYTDQRIYHLEELVSIELIERLLEEIESRMDEEDSGIWEYRGKKAKHLETYLFHWAGAKAAMKIGKFHKNLNLIERASQLAKLAEINIEKCYNLEFECYMADQNKLHFDASAFLLITMNYLAPEDERTHKHFQRLQKELLTPEGMVYRYRAVDDFGDTHATFLICTYWYIESLICLGFLREAEECLGFILSHSNHLGLLSEDLTSEDGGQWGNFPQTYSHVGLINAVCRLARKRDLMIFE
jgi:GH15 family glucan-1,4-alpha-glucosidase